MKRPIPEEDLNKDELEYDVDTNSENYIKWITRGAGGFKGSSTGLYAENNNNVATTSQENIFTNENQNDIDILAASAGYNTSNVTNKCFTAPLLLQETTSVSRNPNIKKSTEKYIVNETSDENMSQDTDDLDIYPKFQEHYTQGGQQDIITHKNNDIEPIDTDEGKSPAVDEEGSPDSIRKTTQEPQDSINGVVDAFETEKETLLLEEINRELYACETNIDACETKIQTLLLDNKELENHLRKALNKTYDPNTEIEENEEPRDSIRKEDVDEELTDTDGQPTDTVKEEPPDNMRNRKKNFNQFLKKDIGALNNIMNIKNNKTLEINEYGNGCFDISYK